MNNYQIFTDSSCDLPAELLEKNNIISIPFYVSFDQEHYDKEIVEISIEEFYDKLTSSKIFPKTSLPSVQDYITHFTECIKNEKDVLCICLTPKFSGSYQAAVNAKEIVLEEYPDAVVEVVNSIQATGGQGLTVLQAAYMQQAGYSIPKVMERLEDLKPTSRITFTVGTLEYLQKGGRIGKVSSLAGTILNLKPLIQLKEGELIPYGTIRGRNKSLDKIVAMTKEYFDKREESYDNFDFAILSATTDKEALKVKAAVEELIGRTIDYPLFRVGVTIGTYTGPDAVGITFIKKFDK